MKKITIILLVLLISLSCTNEKNDIVNEQCPIVDENEIYFNNNSDTTVIQLNIFDLRQYDFKCFFNVENEPIKFEVYSSNTLIFNTGYNGYKTYQLELDSILIEHNLPTEKIKNYAPFNFEQIFNIGGKYSSVKIYIYAPLGGKWSFMWQSNKL
jgi:hypothetical protein